MARPSNVLPTLPVAVASLGVIAFSASELQAALLAAATRGPGGYLSPFKIGALALVFFIWVRLTDWMNRDAIRIGEYTGHPPQVWNPINLAAQLVGFLAAITIPIFWAGYPLYLLCSFLPWMIYMIVRRGAMKQDSSIKQRLNPEQGMELDELEQDQGALIDFTAAGDTGPERQANLIRDYSQTQATPRILVDGTWHPIAPMDREMGDEVLYSLKYVAGLNPAERRARQTGQFALKSPDYGKRKIEVMSQGIPNGERVQVKIASSGGSKLPLKKLGMLPSMEGPFSESLNQPHQALRALGTTGSHRASVVDATELNSCPGRRIRRRDGSLSQRRQKSRDVGLVAGGGQVIGRGFAAAHAKSSRPKAVRRKHQTRHQPTTGTSTV